METKMTELEKSLLIFLASNNDGEYKEGFLQVDFMRENQLANKVDQDRVINAINDCIEKGFVEHDEKLHRFFLTLLGRSQM